METEGEEQKEKLDRTCVSPLVSLQLVRAGELPSAVCELALVGLLTCTRTQRQTGHYKWRPGNQSYCFLVSKMVIIYTQWSFFGTPCWSVRGECKG